jgi:hypothetical protein
LSSRTLQGQYTAALSKITGAPKSENHEDQKRHTPICQRTPQPNEKQALREAANALSAIWKIGQSRR